jgi:hypothetical protein
MKRELKFRAWDTRAKKMRTDFVLAPTKPQWSPFIIHGGGESKLQSLINNYYRKKGDILGGDYTLTDWTDCSGDYLEIMQYTGLRDKNGKEIYEGDIVKWVNTHAVVEFREGEFIASIHRRGDMTYWQACVVVGNIYENPELLKEQ